jgi:hypothetical protein
MKSSRKVWGVITAAICLLSFGTPLSAATDYSQRARYKDGSALSEKMHILEVTPELYSSVYKEPDVGVREKGMMGAIGVSYAYHNDVMFKIEGRYFYGKVDYENSGNIDGIRDYGFEARLLGGYDFKPTNTLTITPSIGFGYRYYKDDAAGRISTTGALGYSREANYYYSPIGVEVVQVINDLWSVGTVLEYDYFWGGVQQSNLRDIDSSAINLRNEQHSGYGLRASLVAKRQTGWGYLAIEPFIRYWNIEKSAEQIVAVSGNSALVGFEPANNTTEIGLRVGIGF